jgi:hypothetical protein
MSIFRVLVGLVFVSAVLGGCSTTGDALRDKEGGTAKVYPVTQEQAWDISRTVFRWEGSDAIEEHKTEGYMVTSSGMNFMSYGTVMAAWVEPTTPNETKVTVVTKRRLSMNLVTTLTESTFHNRFAQAVAILKSGATLPATPPN